MVSDAHLCYHVVAMLEFSPNNAKLEKEITALLDSIEQKRGRKVVCFHQGRGDTPNHHEFDDGACTRLAKSLEQLGKQERLSILVESPGGDIDCAFRSVRILRHQTSDVEVLVPRYAKSAATFFCLAADTIYMGRDAELGPLDTQLRDPRGSVRPRSALNAFKSLEYLRQYLLETLDQVVVTLMMHGGMDIPFALEAARPLVADIVTPLYQQVDPHELGEARRSLAVGEEYSKMVMGRYSYRNLSEREIEKIVRTLVWEYPSHGFIIDLEEAKRIGLNAKPLDEETAALCSKFVSLVNYCYGFAETAEKHRTRRRSASKAADGGEPSHGEETSQRSDGQ